MSSTGRRRSPITAATAVFATAVFATAVFAAAACGGSSGSGTMAVTDAFLPEPPGQVAALYFTVANGTGRDDRLVGVDTAIAEETQLHETVVEGDRVTMRSRERVPVPDGDSVTFAPAGLHVMLVGVQAVREGEQVEVVLRFELAAPVVLRVPVGAIGSTEPP